MPEPIIYSFPTFPISEQLFRVPGMAVEGGFTAGGARITLPEPGGFGELIVRPSLQILEYMQPWSSWLQSMINGEYIRVRMLAETPQIASRKVFEVMWGADDPYLPAPWSNHENWTGDLAAVFADERLEGQTNITIEMEAIGPVLRPGHVIGHKNHTYLIRSVEYSETGKLTAEVVPPLRQTIEDGDEVFFRPWFIGQIANGQEIVTTYESGMNGNIQLPAIRFKEVIVIT